MTDIVEVALPPSVSWWVMWFALLPILVGLLVSFLDDMDFNWFGMGAFVSVISAGVSLIILISIQTSDNEARIETALENHGYSEVDYDGNYFTAVYEGERIRALLDDVEVVDELHTYQIVVIPPVSK